jgi:hypothetical protein
MRDHSGKPTFRAVKLLLALTAGSLTTCRPDKSGADAGPFPPGTPLEIGADAKVSVGAKPGDPMSELYDVVSPFLLADGRLVVPMDNARSMNVFDKDGNFLATLGRGGSGPGEFRNLRFAWARGDTIEAFDERLRRITRFLPDGSIDVVQIETGVPDLSAVAGPVADGWVLGGVASAKYGGRDELALYRFARDGKEIGEVARIAGFARFRGPMISGPEPLSPRAVLAVNRNLVYVAETLTPKIQVFDDTNSVAHEIAWEPTVSVSPSEAFRAVADSAVARASADRAAATRQQMNAAPVPGQVSVFWAYLVDDKGFIWVRPFEPLRHAAALGGLGQPAGGPGGSWLIFSPEGDQVRTVDIPEDLEPIRITADAIVGIARDSLGVESVRVHTLRRK